MKRSLFREAFILFKNNHMVIQPLFIGILVLMFVVMPLSANMSFMGFIFTLIIAFLCMTAFLSGWYNCVKTTVSFYGKTYENPEQRNLNNLEILKSFFPGVSEYMLPVTVVTGIYIALAYGVFELYRVFAVKLFLANNLPKDFLTVVNNSSQAEIAEFLKNNFTPEQLETLVLIFAVGILVLFVFHIFVLWFAPAVYYSGKNPFIAILEATKFTFKNFTASILIVSVMFLLNIVLSVFNIFLDNQYLAFIPMFLSFLYCMYYVITVFLYYGTKNQDNSVSGPECNG
ncbi:MAG: hypothetical protein K6C94_08945 [Candidatus Gastranaerophilales bacterium]|nr:hypothetical protein [Candidatus Gastranaerophilales bacterium]